MTTLLFELFERGGPVMWPILLCSVAGVAIILERIFTLSHLESETARLREGVRIALQKGRFSEAERLVRASASPLGRIIAAGFRRVGRSRQEMKEAMEEAGGREVPLLEKHVPMLGTIAHISPLLGLLGTVTGLVRCFQVIQEKATSVNPVHPGDLAGGIWEALLTTVFGLLVAIPLYTVYNLFVHRISGMLRELEFSALDLTEWLSPPQQPSDGATRSFGLLESQKSHAV